MFTLSLPLRTLVFDYIWAPKRLHRNPKNRIYRLDLTFARSNLYKLRNPFFERVQTVITKVHHGPPVPRPNSLLCLWDLWGLWWFWRFHLYTANHSDGSGAASRVQMRKKWKELQESKGCTNHHKSSSMKKSWKKPRNPNKIRFMPFEATCGPQRNSPDEQSLYSVLGNLFYVRACISLPFGHIRIHVCSVRNTQQLKKQIPGLHAFAAFVWTCVCVTTFGHPKDRTGTSKK